MDNTLLHYNGATSLIIVEDVAERLGLKRGHASGQTHWCGANPCGGGATHDGFILFESGNAWDRPLDRHYTSREIAELAGIAPEEYEPYARWRASRAPLRAPRQRANRFEAHRSNARGTLESDRPIGDRFIGGAND